jgi:hypothetical protein
VRKGEAVEGVEREERKEKRFTYLPKRARPSEDRMAVLNSLILDFSSGSAAKRIGTISSTTRAGGRCNSEEEGEQCSGDEEEGETGEVG